jgi:hypothetical protein
VADFFDLSIRKNILSVFSCNRTNFLYTTCMEVTMTESKDARLHAKVRHVEPARKMKIRNIDLDVDGIQQELGWRSRRRQIISALWAEKFEIMARVKNLGRPGLKPQERSGVILHFEVLE